MNPGLLGLGACAGVVLGASAGRAAAPACEASVTGGTAREQQVAGHAVCAMPGTAIRGIEIYEQPPDAPSGTLWLVIRVPHAKVRAKYIDEIRGGWEADV